MNIDKREITTELQESYLDYAMSVIVARALPDVRDGLKPVQRRILWAMWDTGLKADAKLRKSATVVGEVMGKYHPHGDSAIYDTLVRMAQDFSLRYPLIIGQGNWGCFTGDTKVVLTDGRSVSFENLVKEHKEGKKNYTYTFNLETQKTEISEIKNPRRTQRDAEIMKVVLDDGKEIRCTPNHRFLLRDGTYKEAHNLAPGDSLMPGYFRLSTKKDDPHAVGYTMIHEPLEGVWRWAHRLADEWNLRHKVYATTRGKVRHHRDINKLNNNPENIVRLGWKEHWQLHAQLASWRHHHDPQYVEKLAQGRKAYIDSHRHLFAERARNLNKKLWKSNEFRAEQKARIQEMWKDPAYKKRMAIISSVNLKKKWTEKTYRESMSALKSEEMKTRWEDPAYRAYWQKKTKEISKKIWSNPLHRTRISQLTKERTNDPMWRAEQSERSKALWKDSAYRSHYSKNHFSEMAKKLWNDPTTRVLHSAKARAQWENETFRTGITESTRKRMTEYAREHPEHFKKMAEIAKDSLQKKWQDPNYRATVARSKILGYTYSLLKRHETITPELYEQERTNNGVPRIEKALTYFKNFQEILEHAPLYNHTVTATATIATREDVYDITVDHTHNFLLDVGIFVHNSVDGDNAAAMRYTETKLSKISAELLTDIDKETVDWQPNYDGSREEPKVLPAALPNMLLNGTMGIAVGMATSIPPHHLGEVVDATLHFIDHPKAGSEDLTQFIQGPDFPTGGIMYNKKAIIEVYKSGRGPITVRAKAEIKDRPKGKNQFDIVITEIPYQVNKSELIVKIAELHSEKRIEGIRDLRDESDKDGLRIVVELKNDAVPQKVLNQLFNLTDLQKDFHVNMVALAGVKDPKDAIGGVKLQPQTMSLRDIIAAYVTHRDEIVRRRAQFDLKRAEERAHILMGLAKALSHIDEVIATIKKSKDREDAFKNLIAKFKFSEIQTNAILEMRLQTLAALERQKIEDELKEKRKLIEELQLLLRSPEKIKKVIKDELLAIKAKYNDERRTRLVIGGLGEFKDEDLIPEEEAVITFSESGYIKRLPPGTFRVQQRGGKGLIGSEVGDEDFLTHIMSVNTHDNMLFFTDRGRVFQTKAYEIPQASRTSKGKPIHNFLEVPLEEKISAIVAYRHTRINADKHADKRGKDISENLRKHPRESAFLVMLTKQGVIKKTALAEFGNVRRTGIIAISLKKDDLLKWVRLSSGNDEVILTTSRGQAIRFKESQLRPLGRTAGGVTAIRLKKGDEASSMDIVEVKSDKSKATSERLLVIMANGYGKQTALKEYKVQRRGGTGILTAKITAKTGPLVAAHLVGDEEELIALSAKGQVIRAPIKEVRTAGRATQGVRIMSMSGADKVVGIVCL